MYHFCSILNLLKFKSTKKSSSAYYEMVEILKCLMLAYKLNSLQLKLQGHLNCDKAT